MPEEVIPLFTQISNVYTFDNIYFIYIYIKALISPFFFIFGSGLFSSLVQQHDLIEGLAEPLFCYHS